eukprot:3271487-Amphidinium_carterae.1
MELKKLGYHSNLDSCPTAMQRLAHYFGIQQTPKKHPKQESCRLQLHSSSSAQMQGLNSIGKLGA